ncbi:MAG: hypothetical protein AAF647_10620, partial [Pseudomonadota bacterium]
FLAPSLADIGSKQRETFANGFGDAALGLAILENRRLEERVLEQIVNSESALDAKQIEGTQDAVVIELLMARSVAELELLMGMVWHKPTVLDWLTWGRLGLMLPGVDGVIARIAVSAVDAKARADAGAPNEALADLPPSHLREDGALLLASWMASLSPELAARLQLFAAIEPGHPDDRFARLVQISAQALYAAGAS